MQHQRPRQHRRQHGFSLTELLVILAILAIFVAIVMPSLRSVRKQGQATQVVSVMRSLGMSIQQYGFDNNLAYPHLGIPGDPTSPTTIHGVDISNAQGGYFRRLGALWPSAVGPYITGRPQLDSYPSFSPYEQNHVTYEHILSTRFWMTHTAFALPEFWDPMVSEPSDTLLDGTRSTHVRHPARKGLLLDISSPFFLSAFAAQRAESNVIHVLMADGSGGSYPGNPQAPFVRRRHAASPLPIMSTAHGLRGVDF